MSAMDNPSSSRMSGLATDRQGRPIDIIDDAGNYQHSQRDTLNRFKTWCRVFQS